MIMVFLKHCQKNKISKYVEYCFWINLKCQIFVQNIYLENKLQTLILQYLQNRFFEMPLFWTIELIWSTTFQPRSDFMLRRIRLNVTTAISQIRLYEPWLSI
jgi:hypothetical protein